MPRQVFTAGEILTAANMNDLADSTVMVFDSSAARGSAIPTPSEGMVTYLRDTNKVEVYDGAAFGAFGGKILQVLQTVKTDTFSSASTTFVDITGMSVSITPSSATSKIFVMAMVALSSSSADGGRQIVFVNLVRDSTTLFIGDAAGSRERTTIQHGATAGFNTSSQYVAEPSNLSFLDSPASTSALTYKLQIRTNSGASRTAFLNRGGSGDSDDNLHGRSVSSITVMEVAG